MVKKNKKIYFDYAATTPVDPRVLKAMLPYFSAKFGNSVSFHGFGQEAAEAAEKSRQTVADLIHAEPEEIFFTASATESNNWALKGVAQANKNRGKHILISSIEHDCVLNGANWLAKQGFEVEKLPVDKYGLVKPADVAKAIRPDTILVSVMHANNEIGTIQPIAEIGKAVKRKSEILNLKSKIYFHTDAAQSFGKIPIDVKKMNLDLLTASSHKIYGPKGAALLYIGKGIRIDSLLHGGGHEKGLRPSTVNVPAIVGFAEAIKICRKEMVGENDRLTKMRDKIIKHIFKKIPNSYLNGHPSKRLSNNVNIRFSFVEGEGIMALLDGYGLAVSTGSACSSTTLEPSHVLLATGLKPAEVHGSLRISLGRFTTKEEVNYLLKVLPGIVSRLREISPFKR